MENNFGGTKNIYDSLQKSDSVIIGEEILN